MRLREVGEPVLDLALAGFSSARGVSLSCSSLAVPGGGGGDEWSPGGGVLGLGGVLGPLGGGGALLSILGGGDMSLYLAGGL